MTAIPVRPSNRLDGRTDWSEPLSAWPELDVAAWTRWRIVIAETCSAVLRGREPRPLVSGGETDAWTGGIAAFTTGLGPLLGHWVERGILAADAHLAGRLSVHLDHALRRHRRLAAEAARIIAELAGAGVPVVVLKGLHTASYYPEPGARPFSDIDLLIAPGDLPAAEAVLLGLAFAPGPVADRQRRAWYPAGARALRSLEFTHSDNTWSVDLHWALSRTRYRALQLRFPDVDPGDCPPWPVLDTRARALPAPLVVPFLAVQAVEHLRTVQLLRIVDLVQVIRAEAGRGTLDWLAIDEVLARHDIRHHAYAAFRLVEDLVPGTVDSAFLAGLERSSPARLVRAVAGQALSGDPDPRIWTIAEPFLWARGAGEWMRLIWRQLWPGLAYGSMGDIASFYTRRLKRLWRRGFRLRPASAA